jgi:hypothetical protein
MVQAAGPTEFVRKGVGKPMDEQQWETRVAAILGTVHDDEAEEDEIMLPIVSYETLKVYHAFLMQKLKCPFDAEYDRETGPLNITKYQLKVYGLESDVDEFYGILCFGKQQRCHVVVPLEELIVSSNDTNNEFVQDYSIWFANYR